MVIPNACVPKLRASIVRRGFRWYGSTSDPIRPVRFQCVPIVLLLPAQRGL
jgi:hypothetical protein